MFKKPVRVKSNNRMKGSERKRLKQTISNQFQNITEDQLLTILPSKEDIFITKLESQTGVYVTCYCFNNNPLFFEIDKEKMLYPTVYTLWQLMDLVPYMVTWPHVHENISRGADLMLPGVVQSYGGFENIEKGQIMAVRLAGNKASVAVGVAAVSSREIAEMGMKGKGIIINHWYMDSLWSLGDSLELPVVPDTKKQQVDATVPYDAWYETESAVSESGDTKNDVAPNSDVNEAVKSQSAENDVLSMSSSSETNEKTNACTQASDASENIDLQGRLTLEDGKLLQDKNEAEPPSIEGHDESPAVSLTPEEQMDQLIENCFLQALIDAKKAEFPILASTFSAQYLHAACPEGQKIDIKKSRHKKMGKFLEEMERQQLIKIKELSKGVLSFTEINLQNESIRNYKLSDFAKAKSLAKAEALAEKDAQESQQGLSVIELFSVSGKTQPFFKAFGCSKGQAFTALEVRKIVTGYVKENELVSKKDRRLVILDPILSSMLIDKNVQQESLTWDALFERFLSRMNPCHKVIINGKESAIKKGNIENVEIKVEQRMGKKKVTLVKNLEQFGVDPNEFAHQIQLAAASSTTVSPLPGKNITGLQVLIQGNQVTHVAKLLEELMIPKKYLIGLEKLKAKSKVR